MKPKIKYDSIIIGLGAGCFAVTFLNIAYGRTCSYIMLSCTLLIMCLSLAQSRGKLILGFGAFQVLTFTFASYCFFSMLWATEPSLSFTVARFILLTLLLLYMQYTYYQKQPVDTVLMIAMLGGYAASFITVWQQGFDLYLNSIKSGIRVYDKEFINANVAGAMAAHAILINLYFILYKRKIRWWTWLAIPALICIAGAGSKRSLLLLVGGSALLILLHNYDRKKLLTSAFKIFVGILFFVGAIYVLSAMPLFATVTDRIEEFIGSITGTGAVDNSTKERLAFLQVGVHLFKKSPLIGCGIDNPRLFNWIRKTYLHSNMMELLAGGGIIGFGLYYSIHGYLLYNLWKYRAYRDEAYDILLVILIFYLVFDISDMSYDQKDTYFYFMAIFLEVRKLKRSAHKSKVHNVSYIKHMTKQPKVLDT